MKEHAWWEGCFSRIKATATRHFSRRCSAPSTAGAGERASVTHRAHDTREASAAALQTAERRRCRPDGPQRFVQRARPHVAAAALPPLPSMPFVTGNRLSRPGASSVWASKIPEAVAAGPGVARTRAAEPALRRGCGHGPQGGHTGGVDARHSGEKDPRTNLFRSGRPSARAARAPE